MDGTISLPVTKKITFGGSACGAKLQEISTQFLRQMIPVATTVFLHWSDCEIIPPISWNILEQSGVVSKSLGTNFYTWFNFALVLVVISGSRIRPIHRHCGILWFYQVAGGNQRLPPAAGPGPLTFQRFASRRLQEDTSWPGANGSDVQQKYWKSSTQNRI